MADTNTNSSAGRKPIRVWVDGCFDMMHFGHANALRQARAMGDYLVVGVHSDAEVESNKGPCVMKEDERYAAVAACKWVDQVVKDAPYVTTLEMLDTYDIDFVVHGDDITTAADGTDCYQLVKDAGRYKECRRTVGISTTELVGRMLLVSRDHHIRGPRSGKSPIQGVDETAVADFSQGSRAAGGMIGIAHYLSTSKKIIQFSSGRDPKPGDRVVYVDGAFDLFHTGHIEFFKKARELGDYLLVGVHDDQAVNSVKGGNFPVMNLQERVLGVLQCRYVDEVIIGAPYSVTKDVLEDVYHVDAVVHGASDQPLDIDGTDPYALPKTKGIYHEVQHPRLDLTTTAIIERIIENRHVYIARQARKAKKALAEAEAEQREKELKAALHV
ncbi:choline phosphate cytidylyltransferase [Coemansia sp. RSA 1813]|nr:choline phosphate cytidylyltransferase [Coemansia sp. RSA 1646]KAJ1770959.1 choline phosphate cytidylyltransferase [Coemansia sp. RSA 1843]KAJ2088279.1 choline phosphate cytidylyltransferase [Coemansia sp. RSA 986]KAJ2213288.1 choline phosphate cytidylyltransferase [Coemansia sp. RSA 487]KAJ2568131.1 choline phosphate cytidylyltransferase [Coemansia sp. RSA 1813]